MASVDENRTAAHERAGEPVAVIDAREFEIARRDPRVQRFWTDADRYLIELEDQGRNH